MEKIKIIGSGRVVRSLLRDGESLRDFNFEIYSKTPRLINNNVEVKSIDNFTSSDDIILVCTSVCEGSLLKKHATKSRESVFKSNIEVIKKCVEKGYFDKGKVFVLTNPSELIAEYIFRKTRNTKVYALGQEMDIKRYKDLLGINKEVKCLGQHFQYPIVQNHINYAEQLEFRKVLTRKIEEEFIGEKPPFKSGVYNIEQLLKSITEKSKTMVSSYGVAHDSFLCGKLNMRNESFRVNMPSTVDEKIFIDKQVLASKKMIQRYL